MPYGAVRSPVAGRLMPKADHIRSDSSCGSSGLFEYSRIERRSFNASINGLPPLARGGCNWTVLACAVVPAAATAVADKRLQMACRRVIIRPPDRCIALLIGRDGRPLIEVKQPPKLADKVSRLKKGRAEQLTSARPQGNTGTRAECSDGRRCCRDQGLDTEVRQLHRGRWCIGQGEPRRNLRPDWSEWSGQEH